MKSFILVFACMIVSLTLYASDVVETVLTPSSLTGKRYRTTDKDDFVFSFKIDMGAQSADRYSVLLISSQIKNGDDVIGVSQVTLNTNSDFSQYTFFDVVISDVKKPGVFTGEIKIKVFKKDALPIELSIPVELEILNDVEVDKPEPVTASMINTEGDLWQPDKAYLIARLKLKPQGRPAKINEYEMVLYGRTRNEPVSQKILQSAGGITLAEDIKILINDRNLPADTYTGWLKLHVDGGDPIRIDSVTLKVKHGWGWVFFTIALGLLVGRFVRLYNSKETQQVYAFIDWISKLESKAYSHGATEILKQLREMRSKIKATKFDAAAIEKELIIIEEKLRGMEILRDQLTGLGLTQAMRSLEMVKTEREIGEALAKHNITVAPAPGAPTTAAPANPKPKPNVFAWLDGLSRTPAFRLTMMLITLLLVIILGVQVNYVSKPDFGEQGFFDYFNVFLWASGSTVILKSLFSLQ